MRFLALVFTDEGVKLKLKLINYNLNSTSTSSLFLYLFFFKQKNGKSMFAQVCHAELHQGHQC